jgi:hypothetical protein
VSRIYVSARSAAQSNTTAANLRLTTLEPLSEMPPVGEAGRIYFRIADYPPFRLAGVESGGT